jgi:alpha-1,3-glucan synthase
MADLIGFDGFMNESTPFDPGEHKVSWKNDRRYPDFAFSNDKTSTCVLPRFWDESGSLVKTGAGTDEFSVAFDKLSSSSSCYDSDFDQVSHLQVVCCSVFNIRHSTVR